MHYACQLLAVGVAGKACCICQPYVNHPNQVLQGITWSAPHNAASRVSAACMTPSIQLASQTSCGIRSTRPRAQSWASIAGAVAAAAGERGGQLGVQVPNGVDRWGQALR